LDDPFTGYEKMQINENDFEVTKT